MRNEIFKISKVTECSAAKLGDHVPTRRLALRESVGVKNCKQQTFTVCKIGENFLSHSCVDVHSNNYGSVRAALLT